MCPQKHSIGALTREEVACPDCPMTNILPEMPSQEAGRIIHHVRWQHHRAEEPTQKLSFRFSPCAPEAHHADPKPHEH
jgi:hypothetical protein